MNGYKTYQLTFSKKYIPGLDTLYTYKSQENFKEGQVVYVETNSGVKKARVVLVDKQYNYSAEKKFGELKIAYSVPPTKQSRI